MRTPANIAGHPIHPMLVTLPIGLWVFSFVCDLFHVFGSGAPEWRTVALYTMAGGLAGALLAAIPGLIDLVSLPPEPKKTALMHMAINLTVVAIYAFNLWLRIGATEPGTLPVVLSAVGIGLLAISGWLGGKLVFLGGVGVSTGDSIERPGRG